MNRAAFILLIAAVAAYGLFLVLPFSSAGHGWQLWAAWWGFASDEAWSSPDWKSSVTGISFLVNALMIAAAPLLLPAVRSVRLIWWMAVLVSAVSATGFTAVMLRMSAGENLADFPWWIPVSQVLNLAGLLCVRSVHPPSPSPSPHE